MGFLIPLCMPLLLLTHTYALNSAPPDPCNKYISLDKPWRANNATGLNICDGDFSWSGWYRFFYYGMDIRMSDSCVPTSRCGTYYTLWLNGLHPEIEDGVVTRQVCGNAGSDCCYFGSTSVRVKACPGNYYVYELVRPTHCPMVYCTDITTITQTNGTATSAGAELNRTMTTTPANSSFDPCINYTVLDDDWRSISSNSRVHDDTLLEWTGWYRLYLQGESAQLPEGCVGYMSCGGYTPLWLAGLHPRVKDGIVTREIYGAYGSECRYYKSNPVQVKACSGHYYVYRLEKVNVGIPFPVYCAVAFNSPSYDPCNKYTSLDQPWRANNKTGLSICDRDFSWSGWYRFFYYGMNIRMAESCVPTSRCGTYYTLWLNGPHPEIEDGVVTRQVCGNAGSDCCYFGSTSVQVKACPGNYYVYELVRPVHYYYYYYNYYYYYSYSYYFYNYCDAAYCTDVNSINMTSATPTTGAALDTTMTNASFDPCDNYTVLDDYWRTTKSYYPGHDDTVGEWTGWYRLYLQGESAQLPEWCVDSMSCGGYTPLWLADFHPRPKDGIVTREIYGAYGSQCRYYKSNPVQVKACSGQYYVYRLSKPDVSLPMPTYCAGDYLSDIGWAFPTVLICVLLKGRRKTSLNMETLEPQHPDTDAQN